MDQMMEIKKRSALSGWPMILAWMAMLIFAFHASTHMVGAGDTWVAMACGRHFLNHGVDTIEPFSANSHKAGPTEEEVESWPEWAQWITDKVGLKTVKFWHPTGWVNQNWLTHVIFYWLTHESPFADAETLSYNTVVYWKFAVYIITVICVYYTGRLLGVNPALSALFACFAMFVGRSFFDVRPAGFSNLLVALFLLILALTTYRNVLYIWLVVPVTVFWCGVHGGYIYAFIMLVPFVVLNLLTSFSKKRFVSIGLKGVYHTIAAGFVTFLAAIIFNPFHLTNLTHTFLISVSKHAKMWRTVNEWHPGFAWSNPVGTGFPFLVLYILCIGLSVFWLYSRFFKPRFLKAPKNELDQQKKLFTKLSKVFGFVAAAFICRVTFIGFSFINVLYSTGSDGLYGTRDDVLDLASFFIHTAFVVILLLSIYKNVHFIYLLVPLIVLAMGFVDPKWLETLAGWFNSPGWLQKIPRGHGGRYIYPFVILPTYVTLYIVASLFSKAVKSKPWNIILVVATAIAALVLMTVMFNPFKFKSSVWHLEQFLNLRRQWIPQYEGKYKLTYAHLFTALYIINIASVVIWLAVPYLRKLLRQLPGNTSEQPQADSYQLPKIDLALMVIAALTVYMAYRSRRFIPVAAIAACPILAMLIDQMTRTISAACNFHGLAFGGASQNSTNRKRNRLLVPPMPYNLQMFFILVGAVAVVGLGTSWGLKFKCVYLDPWPTDPQLSSVFMRMTASDAKPFYALRFIKNNNLKGKMFNYWTEGGFIAYGQQPDPNTGKTPLQLFMDGRAQAAYEPDVYRRWSDIMSGGSIARQKTDNARARGRKLNSADYKEIGNWINKQLKRYDVWATLMPSNQWNSAFVRGIEYNPDWRLVFLNNKQKLFVDITTKQGEELFNGIFTGKTIYHDDFSKNLILAHCLLLHRPEKKAHKQGLDFAMEAFNLNPSQIPMQKIIFAQRFSELKPAVIQFCKDYLDEFEENKDSWAKKDGYHHRIVAALNAATYLRQITDKQKNAARVQQYSKERREVVKTKRW